VPYIVDGVLVYVGDVGAHFERARGAGARILSEVEDGENGKRYRVEDLEGHRWMFMERS
jgi:PhnB protein